MSDPADRLALLLAEGEGQRLEFKQTLSRLDREIVAFANSTGGRVLVGVEDAGEVVGVDTSNRRRSEIQAIARNCDPPVAIEVANPARGVLEVVVVEGAQKPYRCREGFYLRQGATTQKLSTAEIRRLVLQAGDFHFDESVNQHFRYPQDFDQNRYRAYLQASEIRVRARPEDLLASLDAAVPAAAGISLRQGGVLFFAREPQRFVKESHVSCVRFAGTERLNVLDRKEITGSPPELIEGAIAFTQRNIRTAYLVDARPQRREVHEYPLVAIREAITNAVMHRDYHYDAAHVFVSIFADRLEVENPGGLFSGLSLADLGKRSVRRNRLVADLLFRARYVERVGSGIPRIRQALQENILLSDPQYGATDLDRERFREMLGLNVPAHVAYVQWMRGILLEGTLGQSLLRGHRPVEGKILDRMPVTLELGLAALIIGLSIALPVGIYSAVRQDTVGDYAGRGVAIFGLATPNFWLALMVLIFPGIWWGWTPPLRLFDFSEDPLAHVGMFLIPGLIMGTGLSAATMRMTRTMMLEVLRQDYVRTAWAKGLRERLVVVRHAMKNALIPVVTLIGLQLPILIGGSVIWPCGRASS